MAVGPGSSGLLFHLNPSLPVQGRGHSVEDQRQKRRQRDRKLLTQDITASGKLSPHPQLPQTPSSDPAPAQCTTQLTLPAHESPVRRTAQSYLLWEAAPVSPILLCAPPRLQCCHSPWRMVCVRLGGLSRGLGPCPEPCGRRKQMPGG